MMFNKKEQEELKKKLIDNTYLSEGEADRAVEIHMRMEYNTIRDQERMNPIRRFCVRYLLYIVPMLLIVTIVLNAWFDVPHNNYNVFTMISLVAITIVVFIFGIWSILIIKDNRDMTRRYHSLNERL